MAYVPRLKQKYRESVVPALSKKFQYKSSMQVPRLTKICINQGVGDAVADKKLIESAMNELTLITGQKPVSVKSKKDISNFKLRAHVPIGVRVTLRDVKMYEFLDRLIAVALPRVRDFRGVNEKSFDGRGNYTMGIVDSTIFPEITSEGGNQKVIGMDITIVTTAKTDNDARELLKLFGMPFRGGKKQQVEKQ